jgi:hypothetical protein
VGAEFVAFLDVQTDTPFPFTNFSSPYKDHRRLVIESRPRDGADRGRFSLSRRPLSRGRDRRSGYGVAQFKQAILDFQQ